MTSHHQKVVHIKQSLETNLLSKAQKQFNSLIKKIESEKLLLQTWQVAIQEYAHKIATESEPLWQEYNAQRLQLAQLLDKHFDNKLFKKTGRELRVVTNQEK